MAALTGANSFKVAAKGSKASLNAEYAALAGTSTATQEALFTYVEVVAMYVPPASAEATIQVVAGQRIPLSGQRILSHPRRRTADVDAPGGHTR